MGMQLTPPKLAGLFSEADLSQLAGTSAGGKPKLDASGALMVGAGSIGARNAANGFVGLDANGAAVGKFIGRRMTYAEMSSTVLDAGEFATTSDTNDFLVGDGVTAGGVLIASRPMIYDNAPGVQLTNAQQVVRSVPVRGGARYSITIKFGMWSLFTGSALLQIGWKYTPAASSKVHYEVITHQGVDRNGNLVGPGGTSAIGELIAGSGGGNVTIAPVLTKSLMQTGSAPFYEFLIIYTAASDSNFEFIMYDPEAGTPTMAVGQVFRAIVQRVA